MTKKIISKDSLLKRTLDCDIILNNGERLLGVVPVGVLVEDVHIIAGKGTSVEIKSIDKLVSLYGGTQKEWSKCVGAVKTDNFTYDVHWWQFNGEKFEEKLKGVSKK